MRLPWSENLGGQGLRGLSPAAALSTPRSEELREVALCGLIAAVASALVVFAVPRGGDLAAHLYRTDLVRHGILVWDNLWFTGQYPLSSYSLLYYPLAALVGNATLGVAGVALSAGFFAGIARREWDLVGRWPARVFALLAVGQPFSAAYPYELGCAALLGTIWALQRRLVKTAVCCTLLSLAFSPLAFFFLALTLVAIFLSRRRVDRQTIAVGAALLLAGGFQLGIMALLPSPGLYYPYGAWRLAAGLAIAALGTALAAHGRSRRIASLFLVWACASIVVYAFRSPIGHNFVRVSVFLVPLMLVLASRVRFRPLWLVLPALAGAFAASVLPFLPMIPERASAADARTGFWQPIVRFLETHETANFRVEVVPTINHWEAYYVPSAGVPLARGWYRQLDIADNPELYLPVLTSDVYRRWLRSLGVRYVVVPKLPLEAIDGKREARIVRDRATGLRRVWSAFDATIYELPHPTPILTGPGRATITDLDSNLVEGSVARPGRYALRLRFSPYELIRGNVCVSPSRTRSTRLVARRPGRFVIQAIEDPLLVVATAFDRSATRVC
jgi:hypothetical protein